MVTMVKIQQGFPGYLFLARKRLLKKRTPDYVRSQKFAILYQELQRALRLHCVSTNLTNDCLTFFCC